MNRTATVVRWKTFFSSVFSFLLFVIILPACFLFFDVAFSVMVLQRIDAHVLKPRTLTTVLVPCLALGVLKAIDLLNGLNKASTFNLIHGSNGVDLVVSTSQLLSASSVYLFLRCLNVGQSQMLKASYLSIYLPRHRASSTVMLCGKWAG